MKKYSPVVIAWLAGMTIVASIIGFYAWMWRSIDKAVRLGKPVHHAAT